MAGRNCLVCSDPSLLEIDALLLAGEIPVAEISRRFGISEDSLGRHRAGHLQQIARASLREREIGLVAQFTERLLESADDIRAARIRAADNNNTLALARTAEAEVKIIGVLANRFGIQNTQAAAEVKAAVGVLEAIYDLATERPDVVELLAATMSQRKNHEQASQVRELAERARKEKKEIR